MIRFSTGSAVLGLAAALVAGTLLAASPASAATDSTKPMLAGAITFSPSTVDVTSGSADAKVSVPLADDSSGVASATLTLAAPVTGDPSSVELSRTSGSATNGVWTGTPSFATWDTGKWVPISLDIADAAGNSVTVTGSALGTGGITVTSTSDTVTPTLLGATAAATSADTTTGPVDVVVRVSASDDLSGVEDGSVTFTSPDGDTADGYLSGDPVTGSSTNGSWDVPVTFPARSAPGVWRLSGISLSDGQYNVRDYDADDAALPPLAVQVATADDATAPSLTSFSIGPATLSTAYGRSGYVYAQVAFTDAVSGLASAQVTLQRPNGVLDDFESDPVFFADTDLRTGTSGSGTLTVPVYVDNFVAGTWKVDNVVLTDVAGNVTTVANAVLGTRAKFDVSTTAADTVPPTSSGYAFSPDTLDTRTGPQSGTVLVAATDPDAVPSGVARGEATLTSPSGLQTATATFSADTDLASGDPVNGTFRAAYSLPGNAEDGPWAVTSIKLTDAANRTATITSFASAPTLTVLGQGRAPASPPGVPTVGAVAVANTTATVTWTPPYDTGGARITRYVVSAYRAGVFAGTVTATGTSTTVPGLQRGRSYTFTVAAENAAGVGTASGASTAVTVPAVVPGAPTIGRADLTDTTTATVTWTAATDDGGAAITGYRVTPYVGTTAQTAQTATSVGVTGTATVTDLPRGRTYTFRVAAVNAVGAGAPSQSSNSVSVAATVPASPRVAATRVAGTSATVTWDAPADGGAPITGYRVVGTPAGSCSTAGTSCVVNGLTPDESYSFTVTATNTVGSSPASTPSPTVVATRPSVTTLALGATPATITYGAAVTVAGRLTVAGTGAAAPGQPVRLQYRTAGTGWSTWPAAATTGPDGTVRIGGFRPARSAQFRLVTPSTDAVVGTVSGTGSIAVTRGLTLGGKVRVKRGKTVKLTGRATPVQAGGAVTLQRRSGSRWKAVAKKRVNGSTFTFVVRASKRGSAVYRVVAAGDASFATSVSNTRLLRVR